MRLFLLLFLSAVIVATAAQAQTTAPEVCGYRIGMTRAQVDSVRRVQKATDVGFDQDNLFLERRKGWKFAGVTWEYVAIDIAADTVQGIGVTAYFHREQWQAATSAAQIAARLLPECDASADRLERAILLTERDGRTFLCRDDAGNYLVCSRPKRARDEIGVSVMFRNPTESQ